MDELTLTVKEIEFMYHAVGIDDDRRPGRIFYMYRNYYGAGPGDVPVWDGLVNKGLARKSLQYDDTYHVTEAGMEILERLTMRKFKEV